MIQQCKDRVSVQYFLVPFLMDRSIVKELGEPILFDKGDTFYIKEINSEVVAFAAITDKNFLKYVYVVPNKRGLGLFSDLIKVIEKNHSGLIKATATKIALPMYQAKGYQLIKSFSKYFKIQKQNG
jgi:Acetyltransferase (GNAT) domain